MMMSYQAFARVLAVGVAVAAIGAGSAPASAQGFFDQLFGIHSAPQPAYAPQPLPQDVLPGDSNVPSPDAPRKQVLDEKPVLQKPTDLMHDKTLQVGDAVMMTDGIHIYDGPEAARHSRKQFVALDDAHYMASSSRVKLAALDATRSDSIHEGRSATDIVQGFKITDARGNSIRYVGP